MASGLEMRALRQAFLSEVAVGKVLVDLVPKSLIHNRVVLARKVSPLVSGDADIHRVVEDLVDESLVDEPPSSDLTRRGRPGLSR